MRSTNLRPVDPERDFVQLAAWFSLLEEQPSTEASLRAFYEKAKERSVQRVAENEGGGLLGFCWATRSQVDSSRYTIDLFVSPEMRRQGIGSRLYAEIERLLPTLIETADPMEAPVLLLASVWDTCPECLQFALNRGYSERSRGLAMSLDLDSLDDQPYDALIDRLKCEGFQFTNMAELGNTEKMQRKLYQLNETTSSQTPGTDGSLAWGSFEAFLQGVCQTDWYHPEAQFVVIDTASGDWAAMSAITRFAGTDYAYNLFTGVDSRYRGRKLAQAVKILALRHARQTLQVHSVRTIHNIKNLPMIAIDRKLGYQPMPGLIALGKSGLTES